MTNVGGGPVVTVGEKEGGTVVTVAVGTRIRLEVPEEPEEIGGRPATSDSRVVRLGGWVTTPCLPAHCYALLAVGAGRSEVEAVNPSGSAPKGTCYIGMAGLWRFRVPAAGSS
jgi:hypothetical protein